MGNEEDAKDMLQESFIQAFTKLKSLQEEALFPAWLKRIVVNRCLNQLKKTKDFDQMRTEEIALPHEKEELFEEKQLQVAKIPACAGPHFGRV